MTEQEIKDFMVITEEIAKQTQIPVLPFSLRPGLCAYTDSYVGGTPWLPVMDSAIFEPWPMCNQKPMLFLAQINCAELNGFWNYPKDGLLQFFISDDGLWGLDFKDPTANRSCVRYFTKEQFQVTPVISSMITARAYDMTGKDNPVYRQSRIVFGKPSMTGMSVYDARYDGLFLEEWEERYPDSGIRTVWDVVPKMTKERDRKLRELGFLLKEPTHQLGGYAYFTQDDPHRIFPAMQETTTLLFQLDSDSRNGVMWGDAGVGNFFIRDEDLKNLDFSKVFYNWDCC